MSSIVSPNDPPPIRRPTRFDPPRDRPASRPGQNSPTCVCPVCGGLECLCRPRFFAGQLLTEEDLNRLDHYIRGKHRLHNRYLHGWGTVCGLEVLCHPCPTYVRVTAGYALDPCGNDIVLCAEEAIDFCNMIQECRDRDRKTHPCDPPRRLDDDDCLETETWLLYIEYDEKQTRGITALRGASKPPCCDRCGRDLECGCRCEEKMGRGNGGATRTTKSFRPPPPQCEPTVVCEIHHFGACRLPDVPADDDDDFGSLLNEIRECWEELREALDSQLDQATNNWRDVCCRLKASLHRFFSTHPTTFCDWDERLRLIQCTRETTRDDVINLWYLIVEYVVHCFCSAWLPKCPGEVCDARVPLATVTVTTKDCRVVRICNLTRHRQFVRTPPNMKHWLSPLQVGRLVREVLEQLCCHSLEFDPVPTASSQATDLFGLRADATAAAQPADDSVRFTARVHDAPSSSTLKNLSDVILKAFAAPGAEMDVQQFYRSLTGTKGQDGQLLGDVNDASMLPWWMVVRSVILPVLQSTSPDSIRGLGQLARQVFHSGALSGNDESSFTSEFADMFDTQPSASDEMAALRTEIDALRREVEELRNPPPG